jgi:hypothetical protein
LLTDIWYGKIEVKPGFEGTIMFMLSCVSLGVLAPYGVFRRREKLLDSSDRETTLKNIAVHSRKKDIS